MKLFKIKLNLKIILKITSLGIYVSSILYFIFFVKNNFLLFSNFNQFNLKVIFGFYLILIFNNLVLGLINKYILLYLDINIPYFESLNITVKNSMVNLTTPLKLGIGYKIIFLKNYYIFSLKELAIVNTFFTLTNLFPILITLMLIFLNERFVSLKLFYTLLLIIFLFIYLLFNLKNFKIIRLKFPILKKINFYSFLNIKILFLNFLFFISSTYAVYLIASQINVKITYLSIILFSTISILSSFIQLTPGNIGVREGILIFFNSLHKISNFEIIIISTIERFFNLISLFFLQLILLVKNVVYKN